jgi:hypothetical protein
MNCQQIKTLGGWLRSSIESSRPGQQKCAVGPIISYFSINPFWGLLVVPVHSESELQTVFTLNIKEKMWTTYVVALSAKHVHICLCCFNTTRIVLLYIVRWRNVQNIVANTMSKIRYMRAGSSQWERVREQAFETHVKLLNY